MCDFLERWSTLEEVQAEGSEDLLQFFCEHGSRSKKLNQRRVEEIAVAVPLVTDEAIVKATALIVRALGMQLRTVMDSIATFDREIAELCKAHEDYQIFASFPGGGAALAPRMLAALEPIESDLSPPERLSSSLVLLPLLRQVESNAGCGGGTFVLDFSGSLSMSLQTNPLSNLSGLKSITIRQEPGGKATI